MSEQQIKPKSKGKNLFQLFKESLAEDDADIAEIGRQLRESREGQVSQSSIVQPEPSGVPETDDSVGRHVDTSASKRLSESAPQQDGENTYQPCNTGESILELFNDSAPPQVGRSAAQLLEYSGTQPLNESSGQHIGRSTSEVGDSATRQLKVDESSSQVNHSASQVTNSASRQFTHPRGTNFHRVNESTSQQISNSAIPSNISELCLTHREILQVLATVTDGEINYREMSEWTGIAQGTCRDAMIRLREKNILDFRPASKGRWRGIRIEFTALGLEFLRKSQLLTKSASQHLNESAPRQSDRSVSQQPIALNKIDRSFQEDQSIKEMQNLIDDDFLQECCPIQWKSGLRINMDKYQEAIKVWRQRGLDFSRLGRTLEILEDRYRRDPKIANPAEYTCHTLRTSGYATPLAGYVSPEDQFEQTLAQADEKEKALKEKLDEVIYIQFQTWLVEQKNEMQEHDTKIVTRLENWAKKRFDHDPPFKQLKRLEYFRKNVLQLYSKEYIESAGEQEGEGGN